MTFAEIISLAIGAILVNNVLLSQFLGICSFVGVSKKKSSSLGMGLAVLFVLVMSSLVTWLLYNLVLVPLHIEFLSTIVFILVIATLVQFCEMVIKKYMPALYKALGVYLPLITTNCVVLFVAQTVAAYTMTRNGIVWEYSFLTMLIYAIATAVGYMLVITLFSFIRVRIDSQETPKPFAGNAIALITTALMVLAFSAFVGLV
jgi:electron transport complex protein RnfA